MDQFLDFCSELKRLTGIDLTQYKRPQMERRLLSHLQKSGFQSFAAYANALWRDDALLAQLLDRMTINVSEFFRNPERWDDATALLQQIDAATVRIWSAGCSTGEEPYTMAIMMEERVQKPYQILATDLDQSVLDAARQGMYKAHQLKHMPEAFRTVCFEPINGDFAIRPKYQRHIQFQRHNLLAGPPEGLFHFVVCRNVLIYFTDEGKGTIFRSFRDALMPGGYLFVGSTEQLLQPERLGFRLIRPFLYQKVEN